MENISLNNQIESIKPSPTDKHVLESTESVADSKSSGYPVVEKLENAADEIEISDTLKNPEKTSVVFENVNAGTGSSTISFKVLDKETGEVLQEFPKKSLLDAADVNKINDKFVQGLLSE